ncbi:hypothetical protein K1T71_010519 [Dendrolimus kikuchii]|uniref:Uncharacterized protein n=1 Tax=Dendrolimus kikuchii TaxID=765133 RepID=A0ACC1CS45_9NEOP|nr:hypothetical protein K1T71_010519 [Dendrolimus kikuchii]
MPKQTLFDGDSEEEVSFKTENEYAKKYDKWREKEEIYKLEQKYGTKALNSDASLSSDSEDESDEPPEVSEEMETQFLKTLALLKTKDPRIYDPNYKCFDEKLEKIKEEKPKAKTLTFEDSDEDDDDNDGNIFKIEKKAPDIGNMENSYEDITKKTAKDAKLKEFLTGKAEHVDDDVEKDLAPLKALWSDPKLNEGEAFLRDYILNKRYLEEGDAGEAEDKIRDDEDLEADEKLVEEQGKFERAYNFRFEEPDEEYLKRFPRTMNYIRPKDDRRARKRAEVRERKDEEKQRKMEEIARLKALKLKEIQDKIAKIKEVTGNDDLAFKDEDIEGDFDPEEHDRRMKALFDKQYYDDADQEKPVFPDLDEELEIENWENYENEHAGDQNEEDGPHCEDENFNMDAEYDPKQARVNLLEELKQNMGKKRRNRKKKSKLAELLSLEKPKFVPTVAERTYSEYMEEYYKMDCEDIIGGDLPTRFKYREVVPNDYGLTVEEILLADDRELTQWVPLKKIVKHRAAEVEKGEVKTYAKKAADVGLKKKMLPSLFKDLPEEPEIVIPIEATKTKKKKKKHKNKENSEINPEENNQLDENNISSEELLNNINVIEDVTEKSKKKKKKHKRNENNNTENEHFLENSAMEANNIENTGHKIENNAEITFKTEVNVGKKHKLEKEVKEVVETPTPVNSNREDKGVKKRKQKKANFVVEDVNKEVPSKYGDNTAKFDSNITKPNLKRKLQVADDQNNKINKKHNKKINITLKRDYKKRKFDNDNTNPLVKLSDERLKAYGLNPKKYKKFMRYKKF